MSSKVEVFLSESGGNNFAETAPRPPVPGEENELQSNGGMSTRSSGSHKSHTSHTSGRSLGSNKGEVNPATPRKSNLDKTITNPLCSGQGYDEKMDAPLGYEPEGSVANSPPFTENSTPTCVKWAKSLHILLGDRDGVLLFIEFLLQEGIGKYSVDFWFACQGLRIKQDYKDALRIIKAIHKRYLKNDKQLPFVSADTKRLIADRIQLSDKMQSQLDGNILSIFNVAQAEVEEYMKSDIYPLFLKSDLYVQYVSKGGESPKSSNTSSGSNSARPMSSGPLPTLQEDRELEPDDILPYISGPPLSKSLSRKPNCDKNQAVFSTPYPPLPRFIPHHSSYAPVSAQDSEIQSLSSQDNLTDDTRSLTDSSIEPYSYQHPSYPYHVRSIPDHESYVPTSDRESETQSEKSSQEMMTDDSWSLPDSSIDGHSFRDSRKHRKHIKSLQRKAGQNKEMGVFIPRTERAPKDRNIAEVDPPRFAALLRECLEKVVREREKEERVQLSLSKVMNQSDLNETMDKSCVSTGSSRPNTTATSLVPLLTSSMIEEENADSILEEHCSRIWERSTQQTPSRSPGRHSPSRSKSPDRLRKVQGQPCSVSSGSASLPGSLHARPLHGKKRANMLSMSSFDSGVGEDCTKCSEMHIHHYHHHHHSREGRRSAKHKLERDAQHHSMVCYAGTTPRPHSSSGANRKAAHSFSDSASNKDSGIISLVESATQPSINDPSRTKVIQWMMDNDNHVASSTYPDSDKTSSSHKRDHKYKSTALPPPGPTQQQYKQSTSKKGAGGHNNRSASVDSSCRVSGPMVGVQPSQPIVQDPSMPLMPLPNTTVQLEEVNRRLESGDIHGKPAPVKSKSFSGGVPVKDKRPGVPMSPSCNQMRVPVVPVARTVPADLDMMGDSTLGRKDKHTSGKRSSGSGNTSTSSKPDETVIGYYLCSEPIPYRVTVPQASVTLGQLKQLIGKRGTFRYFVKRKSQDFDAEHVYEEVREDNSILHPCEGKVVVKVQKVENDTV